MSKQDAERFKAGDKVEWRSTHKPYLVRKAEFVSFIKLRLPFEDKAMHQRAYIQRPHHKAKNIAYIKELTNVSTMES